MADKVINYISDKSAGFFSYHLGLLEWIWSATNNEVSAVVVNNRNYYNCGNTPLFLQCFHDPKDPKVLFDVPKYSVITTRDFPTQLRGFKTKINFNYISLCCISKEAPEFRRMMAPIANKYFKLLPDIQNIIDSIKEKFFKGKKVIGIHIRFAEHHPNLSKKDKENYLELLGKELSKNSANRDLSNTVIFVSTLLEPAFSLVKSMFNNVVFLDYARQNSCSKDWDSVPVSVDTAKTAIIDTWLLASCDEIWGCDSNMTMFATCLNPEIKFDMMSFLYKK